MGKTVVHNKLVRDNIPEIIRADGAQPVITELGDQAYKRALLEKLVEEATELLESEGSLGERADVAEVLKALDETLGFDASQVESARQAKADKRGGFERRIFLEKVES